MKQRKQNSIGKLKLLLLGACLTAMSASAANGPTNSWSDWQYKKIICLFSNDANTVLVSLNGHSLPAFSTNMFGSDNHLFLYGDVAGDVFGAGDMSLHTEDRDAVFNVEVVGSLSTKGNKPSLSFKLIGDGSGTVNGTRSEATLNAKFVQTQFIVVAPGEPFPETYYSEGKISGVVKQLGGAPIQFEDTVRIPLDNVPGHFRDIGFRYPQFRLDIVDIDGRRFAGHAHGTNNAFGRYEGDPDDLLVSGSYTKKTGNLSMDVRGVGVANDIKGTLTGTLGSAPENAIISIENMTFKGRAYGQKPKWTGFGYAYQFEP